jgi:hypothetical protein
MRMSGGTKEYAMDRRFTLSLGASWGAIVVCLALLGGGCEDDMATGPHDAAADHDEDGSAAHDHDMTSIGPASGATCPANSSLTYDNFGKDFMTKYCLRCHSSKVTGAARMMAPADHNFDTLAEIALLTAHIDQYAAAGPASTNEKMPLNGAKPSLDERKKLGEWLACDAP